MDVVNPLLLDEPGLTEEPLTKVRLDLPNHWQAGGESLWARVLGNNLYEIRNVPFCAYGLNYLDIVEAIEEDPSLKPKISKVVRPSGHQTLRVIFSEEVSEDERFRLLRSLESLDASFERGFESYFALDIEPGGDYDAVRDQLDRWQDDGLLEYETCEARVEGSFDAQPEDEP